MAEVSLRVEAPPVAAVAVAASEDAHVAPNRKRPRLDDAEEQKLKVAGFSLSAIEEMKHTRDVELTSEPMDQQLRQFQVLDEVATASEEDDESGERFPLLAPALDWAIKQQQLVQ